MEWAITTLANMPCNGKDRHSRRHEGLGEKQEVYHRELKLLKKIIFRQSSFWVMPYGLP
jgi:hypothetical protein